jgi:hypothetical protein
VEVDLPHIARIHQANFGTELYFAPTLSSRVKTERVEVIKQVELQVRPTKTGVRQEEFFWDESGYFSFDDRSNDLTYQYQADPSPLLVSQSSPQQPGLLFTANKIAFSEGRYEGRLVLQRASGQAPLTKKFCLIITKDALSKAQEDFLDFRDDLPDDAGGTGDSKSCYVPDSRY